MAKKSIPKTVEVLKHDADKRKNIPTAEYQSVLKADEQKPVEKRYPRNTDLDPQLVWRGKDEQDWSDLVVHAPPLYIQEKVHPKVLIDDLRRVASDQWPVASDRSPTTGHRPPFAGHQLDLFADFNGIPAGADKTEFYQHDQNWSNRMILGDSLQVMASLALQHDPQGVQAAGGGGLSDCRGIEALGSGEVDPARAPEHATSVVGAMVHGDSDGLRCSLYSLAAFGTLAK